MKKNEVCMTEGPLIKNMLLFAIPIMLSVVIQILFNVADTAVVGQFAGKEAMASVGASGSIISLVVGGAASLATGVGVILAHLYGKKDEKSIDETICTSFIFSLVLGVLLSVVTVILTKKILQLTDCPEDILGDAVKYLKIYFTGLPLIILYNTGVSIIQASGDTKHPLIYGIISGITNIILNLIFVICLNLSVVGVSLATVISEIISAVLIWRYIYKQKCIVELSILH